MELAPRAGNLREPAKLTGLREPFRREMSTGRAPHIFSQTCIRRRFYLWFSIKGYVSPEPFGSLRTVVSSRYIKKAPITFHVEWEYQIRWTPEATVHHSTVIKSKWPKRVLPDYIHTLLMRRTLLLHFAPILGPTTVFATTSTDPSAFCSHMAA